MYQKSYAIKDPKKDPQKLQSFNFQKELSFNFLEKDANYSFILQNTERFLPSNLSNRIRSKYVKLKAGA